MSVEALLSEVRPSVLNRPVLEAADTLFYHDRRALSDVKPETSHTGGHGHHGLYGRGGKNHSHEHPKAGDKVLAAINDAKNTIHKAKNHRGRNRGNSHKSESSDEVSQLRKDLDELRINYDTLKSELDDLRKLVKNCLSIQKFLRIGQRVLVLGDGNLSFSLALARLLPDVRVTATVLESENDFSRFYPTGICHLDELRKLQNVEVVFGVDARHLPLSWNQKYSDVIMNFPHQGGKTNLRKSRLLMNEIFAFMHKFLSGTSIKFHLTLMSRQAGLSFEEAVGSFQFLDHLPSHNKDSWNIAYLAADHELCIDVVDEFLPGLFQEYIASGYNNREYKDRSCHHIKSVNADRAFHNLNQPIKMVFIPNQLYQSFLELPCRSRFLYHPIRPYYLHDISILYTNDVSDEATFLSFLTKLAKGCLVDYFEVSDLSCICPRTLLPNRIYRLVWQPCVFAIGKQKCNAFQEQLRSEIVRLFVDHRMPFVLT